MDLFSYRFGLPFSDIIPDHKIKERNAIGVTNQLHVWIIAGKLSRLNEGADSLRFFRRVTGTESDSFSRSSSTLSVGLFIFFVRTKHFFPHTIC